MRRAWEARLTRLEQQSPGQAWQHGVGLAALLRDAAEVQPAPWDLAALGTDAQHATGLMQLLQEARRTRAGP